MIYAADAASLARRRIHADRTDGNAWHLLGAALLSLGALSRAQLAPHVRIVSHRVIARMLVVQAWWCRAMCAALKSRVRATYRPCARLHLFSTRPARHSP